MTMFIMTPFDLQAKAEYAPYYRNSLLYLACVDPATDMSTEERLVRAHDLGVSAFLGDTIYNFGELVRSSAFDVAYSLYAVSTCNIVAYAPDIGCAQRDAT